MSNSIEHNAFETQGAFSWAELMTSDPAAAKEFYGHLFGWEFEDMPMEGGEIYNLVKIGDAKVAGIMSIPTQATGTPPNWGNYVTVSDVDATAMKVSELGGNLLVPPTDIPNVGRFSMLQDPQGATISIIQYAQPNEG